MFVGFQRFLPILALLGSLLDCRAESGYDAMIVQGLSRALQADPDNTKARLNRGLYYLWRMWDYEKALADFNRVLELEPDNAKAYIGRADVYTGWDSRFYDPGKAKEDADKALSLAPESSEAFRIQGDLPTHPGMGNTQDSFRHYKKAVDLDPTNLLAQIGLAYFYAMEGTDFHSEKRAFEHARHALWIGPNESLALEALGDLLAAEESTRKEGLRMLNRAARLNPRSVGTFLARGYNYLAWSIEAEWPLLFELLDAENLSVVDRIRGNDSAFEKAMKRLGRDSRFARALRDFDKAEELCPHNDDVFSAQAYALQSFPGQERRALNCYNRAVELNPYDAKLLVERAEFLMANPLLVIDPADAALRAGKDPDSGVLQKLLAKRFPLASRKLEADLGKALALEKDSRTYFLRGSLRGSALNNYQGAIEDLSAAIALKPLDGSYYEARASVHEAFGHYEKAEQDWAQATDLEDLD